MMDWTTLNHAYGAATDVPALLASLSPDPQSSEWEKLWSRLCHQGTVYSASFAVLPALLDIADRWSPAERAQVIALAASILASEDVQGSRDDFLRPVESVVPRLRQMCHESLTVAGLSAHDFVYLLQAARSFEGDMFWGQKLDHLASGEFPGTCPHCGVDLYIVIGEYGCFTTADDWIQRPATTPGVIEVRTGIKSRPIERNHGVLPEVGRQMFEVALAASQEEVANCIRHVFGSSECPLCGEKFDVQRAIGAAVGDGCGCGRA